MPRPFDESALCESLRFCSLATRAAARAFLQQGDLTRVPTIINGVIEGHVDPELRAKLHVGADTLRLREDLALDSLCMMEIVLVFDDVLNVTVSNEELSRLRTLGDVQRCFLGKVRSAIESSPASSAVGGGVRPFADTPHLLETALSATAGE